MSMDEIDIASFAESMLNERVESGKPVQFSAEQAPDAPDVSDIEVPAGFASTVLSEGHWDKADINISENIVEEVVDQPAPVQRQILPINEESVYKKHLLSEYKKKVSDLQELIDLMENMGMVGSAPVDAVNTTGRTGQGPMRGTKRKKKKKSSSGRLTRSYR